MSDAPHIELLHEFRSRIAGTHQLHKVLERVVDFVTTVVECDSCFIYVLEEDQLTLRASKNPHPEVVDRLQIRLGTGITGWVAEHRQPVAIPRNASQDPRFQVFNELPEDRYDAFLSVPLLCQGKVVGVINLQHRKEHEHSHREIQLLGAIGFLVGAEIELARLAGINSELSQQLESRKVVERAKGILQRELGINEEQAYLTLRKQSRQLRKSMKDLAEAIIFNHELKRANG